MKHATISILLLTAIFCPGPANAQSSRPRFLGHDLEAPPARATAIPDPDAFASWRPQEPSLLHPATGELQIEASDLFVAGRGLDFELTRKYRSGRTGRGPVGIGWDHSYNIFVTRAG